MRASVIGWFAKDINEIKDLASKIQSDVKEAVKNSLEKIDVQGVKIKIIRSGIGTITESDVVLANASNALILGFCVSPSNSTKEIAKEYGVSKNTIINIFDTMKEFPRGKLPKVMCVDEFGFSKDVRRKKRYPFVISDPFESSIIDVVESKEDVEEDE